MISFYKYDVIVVRFLFASSLKYKARLAVVISSTFKASIVTIGKDFVLTKLGSLKELDRVNLDKMLKIIC